MDTRTHYQQLIEQILVHPADPDGSQDSVVTEAIFDHERSRYVLMNVVAMRPWGSEFFDHASAH